VVPARSHLRAQKFFDKAEEQFKKVLAVNPKNAPVLNYYGYMLGDWDTVTKRKGWSNSAEGDPFKRGVSRKSRLDLFQENKFDASEIRSGRPWSAKDTTPPFIASRRISTPRQAGGNLAAAEWESRW